MCFGSKEIIVIKSIRVFPTKFALDIHKKTVIRNSKDNLSTIIVE